jgi:hypothetical protein
MNETSGTALYDYVGGHNGQYHGGVTLGQPGISSFDTNQAALFDGSSGYAQVPYSAGLNPPNFSVECWVYPTGGAGSYRSPFSNRDTANGPQGYLLYANDQDLSSFWIGGGSASWQAAAGPAVPYNQWTHLVGTFDGTNQVFYVNGQQVVSQAALLSLNTEAPLNIGAGVNESSPQFFWPGRINEVAIYPTALATAQVLDHYALATSGTLPPQILHFLFANGKLTLNWTSGTLLQAPTVLGPWTTNLAASPFEVTPTNAQMYYRLIMR